MKICKVKGCKNKLRAKGYCATHWSQIDRNGYIKHFTRLSPNKIIIKGNVAKVILCDTHANEVARTTIDIESVEKAKKHKWYLSNKGYPITRVSREKQMFLHRYLLNTSEDKQTDHIDGNPLNNTMDNLREVTHQQNIFNSKVREDNTSGVTGVSWFKQRRKWRARIAIDGKEKHLGLFTSKEEAVEAREKAEIKYFGEYRRI